MTTTSKSKRAEGSRVVTATVHPDDREWVDQKAMQAMLERFPEGKRPAK